MFPWFNLCPNNITLVLHIMILWVWRCNDEHFIYRFGTLPTLFLNSSFSLVECCDYYFWCTDSAPISAQVHNKDGLISSMAVSIYLKLERCASFRHVGFFYLCIFATMLSSVILSVSKYGMLWMQWREICPVAWGERWIFNKK